MEPQQDKPNQFCECGRRATIAKWGRGVFICERCFRIEEMLEKSDYFQKRVKPLEDEDEEDQTD